MVKIKAGSSSLKNISDKLIYIQDGKFYGFLETSPNEPLYWEIDDYTGREAKCTTRFEIVATEESQSKDFCEASGCPRSFVKDGWCD